MILGEGIVARSRTWALTILEILAWLPKIEPRISERTSYEQYANFFAIVAIAYIPHIRQNHLTFLAWSARYKTIRFICEKDNGAVEITWSAGDLG